MYTLIREHAASMAELKETYTLDEALKLYDLIVMQRDIERMMMNDKEME